MAQLPLVALQEIMNMKTLLSLLAALTLICCNNNKGTAETAETSDKKSGGNAIEFKVDGKQVETEGWAVQRFVWDDKTTTPWLNITSNMHKDKQTINVNLNGSAAGTYNFTDGQLMEASHGTFFPDYDKLTDSYTFKTGTFTITEVDTVKNILNGTFSGTVTNNEGKSFTITDGKLINLKLKEGVTNISKGFGQ